MNHPTAIYLDYAAATPVDERVQAVMQPFLADNFYNPSATYSQAVAARQALQQARVLVAAQFAVRPTEIIFTAGGTEANNLAIHGVMRRYPSANLITSAIEHDSVLEPAKYYSRRQLAVSKDGLVTIADLRQLIDAETVLVSIIYANNEIGTIQPLRQIGQLLTEIRAERRQTGNRLPLYFHTDACQAAGYLDLQVARLGIDLLTVNGGKLYGPKQSGALVVRGALHLQPLIDGGGQERGLRSGTENVAACVGFGLALQIAQNSRHDETRRLQGLQQQFYGELRQSIPAAIINGSINHRLPNNIHLTLPGNDNERLLIQLDEAGIMAAAGSACSASNEEPSHVLRAIGLDDKSAQASLRFSLGRDTTADQLSRTIQTLASLLA